MRARLRFFIALAIVGVLVGSGGVAFAKSDSQSDDCISSFYRTKDAACLDRLISTLDKLPTGTENGTIIGFFAALFDGSPELRRTLLDGVPSDRAAGIYLAALRKAGLTDDARRFASSRRLEDRAATDIIVLKDVLPASVPSDNDLLLGAYMATGDMSHIDHILENLRTSRDGMAADAIRIGLVMGKFGGAGAPDRPNLLIIAACRKYGCPKNQPSMDMMRSLTLASAVWALESLAKNDAAVRQELDRFFEGNPRLAAIFAREQNAFANYLTFVALWPVKKDESLDAALTDYERLGAADALLEPDGVLKSLENRK